MVQRFIILLIQIITGTFFRRIDVVGEENIPTEGPVIFAGNHPNALMDGWLLISKCGRWPIHFMANASLWKYRFLGRLLDASGAVPVYRREEHDGEVDNSSAFDKLYEVIEAGNCMGIFPEGVSHTESQLAKLKTGAARIALSVAARRKVKVTIIPCGLNYLHRHRFRSQVLIDFGEAIIIDDTWLAEYAVDDHKTVHQLTEFLAKALEAVTLNAPDWSTLRFAQTARRLYKPATAKLSPGLFVELNRRFVDTYLREAQRPEFVEFRNDVENYQSRLDSLGLKDYQLRKKISVSTMFRRLMLRSMSMLLLFPIAIPGVLLHLPVGWAAAVVGERFSYDQDDIATLKVFATIILLPLIYVLVVYLIASHFGAMWALLAAVGLAISFSASIWVIEAEASLLNSIVSILRQTRLRSDIGELQQQRAELVQRVRALADKYADKALPRIFSNQDFAASEQVE